MHVKLKTVILCGFVKISLDISEYQNVFTWIYRFWRKMHILKIDSIFID